MRAAVTGGAGFIGHHLVAGLLDRGHEVSVIDDFSTGHRTRLEAFGDRIRITEGSILDPAALDRAFSGCDVVLHHAAIASVSRSIRDPSQTNLVNVGGTVEVMLASARHRVGRVVFASSSAVYGGSGELPSSEAQPPLPGSPYGVSKLAGEHYVRSLGGLHDVGTVALRYFNVYGPGQDPASEYAAVVPRFIATMLSGRRPTINGSADITRDFVYVEDVVEANILACSPSMASGLTCNIGSGRASSLMALLQAVGGAVGWTPDPVLGPPRPGDVLASLADIALAQHSLGFNPRVTLEKGVALTVAAFAMGATADKRP